MKPFLPKGTRDFGPDQVLKRDFIFDTIRTVFKIYGYAPLETPAMESLSTLTGKYGEEGDRLIFKVLNNGDFLNGVDEKLLSERNSNSIIPAISKRGLRYDLTVPFARFVVMNQHALAFPFKRYQIQPVWRADRPQKGRYQEFYQCDADMVGSDSLIYEAELIQIYDRVFSELNMPVVIKYNNRKILFGIAEKAGITDKFVEMTTALDKLDKIGYKGVIKELLEIGISKESIDLITHILKQKNLTSIGALLLNCVEGYKGYLELIEINKYLNKFKIRGNVLFDISLARGLNYYTGCIIEVVAKKISMGSIGGGGRYDNLTGVFGMPGVSGVGISFGAERIYDVMDEKGLFPKDLNTALKVIIITYDQHCFEQGLILLNALRKENIPSEIYPEAVKIQKQMKYANDRKVPYVILIGTEELNSGEFSLKNMTSGEQQALNEKAIIDILNT
ncbi:MAG TPA: histidine--tRNA ligase [Saprospiraceae bacterium]|nr:histidine--tRNA ligase [Saprospiraceae bacterium]